MLEDAGGSKHAASALPDLSEDRLVLSLQARRDSSPSSSSSSHSSWAVGSSCSSVAGVELLVHRSASDLCTPRLVRSARSNVEVESVRLKKYRPFVTRGQGRQSNQINLDRSSGRSGACSQLIGAGRDGVRGTLAMRPGYSTAARGEPMGAGSCRCIGYEAQRKRSTGRGLSLR